MLTWPWSTMSGQTGSWARKPRRRGHPSRWHWMRAQLTILFSVRFADRHLQFASTRFSDVSLKPRSRVRSLGLHLLGRRSSQDGCASYSSQLTCRPGYRTLELRVFKRRRYKHCDDIPAARLEVAYSARAGTSRRLVSRSRNLLRSQQSGQPYAVVRSLW